MPAKRSLKGKKPGTRKSAQERQPNANSAKKVSSVKSGKKIASAKTDRRLKSAGKKPSRSRSDAMAKVVSVIRKRGDELRSIQNLEVLQVRPGYLFENDQITATPAIIVVINPRDRGRKHSLPKKLGGVPVQARMATPVEQLRQIAPSDEFESSVAGGSEEPDLALPGWDLMNEGELDDGSANESDDESSGLLPYKPPPGVDLLEVEEAMNVTCHVSPEEGWRNLSAFLRDAKNKSLTIAMYDFTAPHVLKALGATMKPPGGTLRLILDPGVSKDGKVKADDVWEEEVRDKLSKGLKKRFTFLWAAVKRKGKVTRGIFPTSYHLKVAVSGGKSFWLSSGNMQSSNQPDVDSLDVTLAQLQTNYNREWHVIVEHRKLASVYEKFIKQDMKQAEGLQFTADSDESDDVGMAPPELLIPIDALSDAEADESPRKSFPPKTFKFTTANPLSVHQLLTPDNFAAAVAPVIRKAKKKLYFQNQYIKVNEDPSKQFESLLDAVLRKVADGLEDVRIILRKLPNSAKELEALQYYALENYKIEDLSFIRYQPGSHTKGIIVDSKNVVIGSHNWSNSGVTNNRDASLIFFNADIAQYYEEVFLYDFDKLAKPQVMSDEEMPLVSIPGPVDVESDSESNLVNVPWDYFEDAG